MEKIRPLIKTDLDLQKEEFMRQNADVLYKLTSQEIGSRVGEAPEEKRHVSDGSFTKHLITAGMYRTSGLNCSQDRERVINGSKDWMLTL